MRFKKQRDKLNQIRRERKYRPSFFGLSVHFDWKMLMLLFVVLLTSIFVYSFNLNLKISEVSEKDFSDEVQVEEMQKIDIEKFDKILKRVESN